MNKQEAKLEIQKMGPQIIAAARKGAREMMRASSELAPRLRQIRPFLDQNDQTQVDRILAAVDAGGF